MQLMLQHTTLSRAQRDMTLRTAWMSARIADAKATLPSEVTKQWRSARRTLGCAAWGRPTPVCVRACVAVDVLPRCKQMAWPPNAP